LSVLIKAFKVYVLYLNVVYSAFILSLVQCITVLPRKAQNNEIYAFPLGQVLLGQSPFLARHTLQKL
jgi:hypothetical protein